MRGDVGASLAWDRGVQLGDVHNCVDLSCYQIASINA